MNKSIISLIAVYVVLQVSLIIAFWHTTDARVTHTAQPSVIMDVLDPSLEMYAPAWEAEIVRRFPHSVGVLCHGGDAVEGQWLTLPYGGPGGCEPIEWVIAREQAKYPDRTIVLLCCNVKHELLTGHPGVYYSPSSVWCIPDHAMIDGDVPKEERWTFDGRYDGEPDDTGNIFEFNEAI